MDRFFFQKRGFAFAIAEQELSFLSTEYPHTSLLFYTLQQQHKDSLDCLGFGVLIHAGLCGVI